MDNTNDFKLISPSLDIDEVEIDVTEGNFVAYDKNGTLTHVNDAKFHTDYWCPICHECRMRLRHKPNSEELIFFKKSEDMHTHPNCYQTDAEKKGKIATPTATDFIDFINKLSHASVTRTGGGNTGGGNVNGGEGGTAIAPTTETDINQITEVSFSSLKQLQPYLEKANDVNPQLIPYVWNYSWINNDLIDSFHSGPKIICARLASYSNSRLLLYIYFGDHQSLRIDVCFSSQKIYSNIKKKIEAIKKKNSFIDVSGAYIAPKINLLIASNRWIFCDNTHCNKNICNSDSYCKRCHGYYRTVIVKDKQLYAYIAEDNDL